MMILILAKNSWKVMTFGHRSSVTYEHAFWVVKNM